MLALKNNRLPSLWCELLSLEDPTWPPSHVSTTKEFNVDVYEKDDEWVIRALVPGVDRENIKLSFDGDLFEIEAEKKITKEEKETDYSLREIYHGKVRRTFKLPTEINRDDISAELKNGILEIVFPKTPCKDIQIKVK